MKKLLIICLMFLVAIMSTFNIAEASSSSELPVNNSILSSKTVWFNCSGTAGSTYNATIGYSNSSSYGTVTYGNDTLSHFTNSTTLDIDSGYGLWHNYTLYEDAVSQGNFLFKVDTTAPAINSTTHTTSYTLGNYTTGGNYLNVTFGISDVNPSNCYAELHYGDGTILNVTDELTYDTSTQHGVCYLNITPNDITKDGYVEVAPSMKDAAGNQDASTTNQSYIFYRLKTGWNLVTGYENKTLSEIADEFKGVTYVSAFDNRGNYKNFTTFTVGGTTNNDTQINHSSSYGYGAAYIYVTEDIVSMRRYYAPPTGWLDVDLYSNYSSTKTGWNVIGITDYVTDVNATIMVNATCTNRTITVTNESINITANNTYIAIGNSKIVSITSVMNVSHTIPISNVTYNESYFKIEDTVGDVLFNINYNVTYTYTTEYADANCANITWASWYDIQNGQYCSFYRNRLATSCSGITSANLDLTRGDALWLAIQDGVNVTIQRGSW